MNRKRAGEPPVVASKDSPAPHPTQFVLKSTALPTMQKPLLRGKAPDLIPRRKHDSHYPFLTVTLGLKSQHQRQKRQRGPYYRWTTQSRLCSLLWNNLQVAARRSIIALSAQMPGSPRRRRAFSIGGRYGFVHKCQGYYADLERSAKNSGRRHRSEFSEFRELFSLRLYEIHHTRWYTANFPQSNLGELGWMDNSLLN